MFGCGINTRSSSESESKKTHLGSDCIIKVQEHMKCTLGMNNDEMQIDMKIRELNGYEWGIESIYVKSKDTDKGFSINGSNHVTMQLGDIMLVESYDINFDGIDDIAISTSFGLANLICDYWLVDKEGSFQFIGNYPKFRINYDQKIIETQVRSSAAEYIQDTYHWEGETLVPDKTVIIGPNNISELWGA